jgi:acyl-CoA dehydrogenase
VATSQRLGEEDHGWTVAKSLLGDERLMVSRVAENRRIFSNLLEVMTSQADRGQLLPESFRREISELELRIEALEMTSLRILGKADEGEQIGAEPSMLKLKGSELVQSQDEMLFKLIDYLGIPMDTSNSDRQSAGPGLYEYIGSGRYHHRGYTIAGGSSEVQHNIIAKQVLGL